MNPYQLTAPFLGESMMEDPTTQLSPWSKYNLQLQGGKMLSPQDPSSGLNLGNFSQGLQQPTLKPTSLSGKGGMAALGPASMIGSSIGDAMGGASAKAAQPIIDTMQTMAMRPVNPNQFGSLDPGLLQSASRRAAAQPGLYGGFFPSVEGSYQ